MEERARKFVAILLCAAVLSLPALYNGYPFLDPDSVEYVRMAQQGTKAWARSIFYSYLIYPIHLGKSLWPVVVAQSLLVAHVLYLTLRASLGRVEPAAYLAVVALLAIFSILPWFTGFIMTDLFGAIAVLSMYLLGVLPHRLSRGESIYLFCLATAATTTHQSYPLVAVVVASTMVILNAIFIGWRGARAAILGAVLPTIIAIAAIVASNIAYHGIERATGFGGVFALARLQADGPATTYLQDRCPEAGYILCGFVDELPMSSQRFIWGSDGVLFRAGGAAAIADEARAISFHSVLAAPLASLQSTLENFVLQISDFCICHPKWSIARHDWTFKNLGKLFPAELKAIANARQQARAPDLRLLEAFHRLAVIAATILCLILLWPLFRRRAHHIVTLVIIVSIAILANTLVMAGISTPSPRYNTRMIWLIELAAIVSVIWLGRHALENRSRRRVARQRMGVGRASGKAQSHDDPIAGRASQFAQKKWSE